MSTADQILGFDFVGQPQANMPAMPAPQLQPGGPVGIIARPPGPYDPSSGNRICVNRGSVLRRRQVRAYQGPVVVGVGGGITYVCSETVLPSKYWVVFAASLIASPGLAVATPAQLSIIPSGVKPPVIPPGTTPPDPYFQNYSGGAPAHDLGPGLQSLRVDKWGGTSSTNGYLNITGDDLPMLDYDKYILLGPGETLIGMTLANGPAQPAGAQLELRVLLAEMDLIEEITF